MTANIHSGVSLHLVQRHVVMVSNHDHANVTTHLQRIMVKIVLDRLLKMHCVELKIVQVCTFTLMCFLCIYTHQRLPKQGTYFFVKYLKTRLMVDIV